MSTTHTPGRITFLPDGDANRYSMLTEDGRWWMALLMNGEQVTARQEANLRRLAACWNACEGIEIESIEELAAMGHGVASLIVYGDDVKRERDALAQALKNLVDDDETPEPNCSCHVAPPCGDCTDYAHRRELIAAAKEALAKIGGAA